MNLVYHPKFCITIVSSFSGVLPWLQSSQEKSKTMAMQNLGGGGGVVDKVHYSLCEKGEWEFAYFNKVCELESP